MQSLSSSNADAAAPAGRVVTRFAPSPTGHVHIGNIRVAIYNWLFARHHGGLFRLRIEDTDRERSTEEAVGTLFKALEWLGLDYDGEPVFQSQRLAAHREAAEQLLRSGAAYWSEKGDAARGRALVFRMPGHAIEFDDLVHGKLRKEAEDMREFVIMRSDGTPVFHLANVVDDIYMGITHVIRGDDHIENTFRHIAIYRALGAAPPHFAHLPMIVNQEGRPYSKRDGAAYVGEFRQQGFLPQALFNYLALLGWSPGHDREIMTREEMVQLFDLDRVRASASQMDLQKLIWMNGEYIRALPDKEYLKHFREAVMQAGWLSESVDEDYLQRVAALLKERIKYFKQVEDQAVYFFRDDYPWDMKAVEKRCKVADARQRLTECRSLFSGLDRFDAPLLESEVRRMAEQKKIKPAVYIHLLRVAVSGTDRGPGLFEMLEVLGRQRVLSRIDRALRELPLDGM